MTAGRPANTTRLAAVQVSTAERTADGEHVVPGINVEDLSELAEGHGTVVLPFEVCRGVGWGGFAAVPGEQLLHLMHLQRTLASTVPPI